MKLTDEQLTEIKAMLGEILEQAPAIKRLGEMAEKINRFLDEKENAAS